MTSPTQVSVAENNVVENVAEGEATQKATSQNVLMKETATAASITTKKISNQTLADLPEIISTTIRVSKSLSTRKMIVLGKKRERTDRGERSESRERTERSGRSERSNFDRRDGGERTERGGRSERNNFDRRESGERTERGERNFKKRRFIRK